jgi:hypothetical protein
MLERVKKALARVLYKRALTAEPCDVCGEPSFDGSCPSCFFYKE